MARRAGGRGGDQGRLNSHPVFPCARPDSRLHDDALDMAMVRIFSSLPSPPCPTTPRALGRLRHPPAQLSLALSAEVTKMRSAPIETRGRGGALGSTYRIGIRVPWSFSLCLSVPDA